MRAMNVCVTRARGSMERKQHGQRSGTLRRRETRVFMRGKNVRGVAPESVHARYAAEVCELREQLTRRAGECGISVPEWACVHARQPAENYINLYNKIIN